MATDTAILEKRWQDYLDMYLPTEKAVARSALAGIVPQHAADMAGTQAGIAFNKNLAIGNRELASYGIKPATGTDLDATTELIRRAAIVGASNNARSAARGTNLTRLAQVAAVGEGIPAQSAATLTNVDAALENMKFGQIAGQQAIANAITGMGMNAMGSMGNSATPSQTGGGTFTTLNPQLQTQASPYWNASYYNNPMGTYGSPAIRWE